MNQITTKELLIKIFTPTLLLSIAYLLLGNFGKLPHILLFCILTTIILVPVELGMIMSASKKEYGTWSLKSAFAGQEKMLIWKVILIAGVFFGVAGLLSAVVAPIENHMWVNVRTTVLSHLPIGFDWNNYEYLQSFSRPVLLFTCIYYGIFNVLIGPITEELFFRGYLTSHYKKQSMATPILIAVLFSLYHFWLPFNNVFRILAFAPVAFVAYKKKNIYISIFFHCLCNFFSVIGFVIAVLG